MSRESQAEASKDARSSNPVSGIWDTTQNADEPFNLDDFLAFASDAETSITQLSAIKNVSGVANVF